MQHVMQSRNMDNTLVTGLKGKSTLEPDLYQAG